MTAQITAVTSDKIIENNWQKDLLDLHRVQSCCKDLFLLHHQYSEAVLRVSLEILTCPTAKKILWWVDGWWSSEERRAHFKAVIREKLGIVLTTKGISVGTAPLQNQEEQDLIANLQSRCKSLEEQVTKARNAQQHAESQFQDVQNLKDAHQATVQALERSAEKLHQRVKELQTAGANHEEEHKALKQHAKQLEESHAAIEKRVSQLHADLKASQASLDAAVESEKKKVAEFDKRMAESVKATAEASKEARANKDLVEHHMRQAEKLEESLNEAKAKLAQGGDHTKEVKIQELKSQLHDQEQRTRAASKQCRAEAGRVQQLEEKLARVDEEAKKSDIELQHLKANMFQRSSVQAAAFLEASDIHNAPSGSDKQTSRKYAKALATGQVHEQGTQVGSGDGDDMQDLGISDLRDEHEALQSVNADLQTEVRHMREQLQSFVNLAGENGLGASAEAIMEAARKRFEAEHKKGESCFMRLYHDAKRRLARRKEDEEHLMGHTPSQNPSEWHHDEAHVYHPHGTTPPRSRVSGLHHGGEAHGSHPPSREAMARPSMRSIARSIAMINSASGSRNLSNGSRASTPVLQMGHAAHAGPPNPGMGALSMTCAGTGMETRGKTPDTKGRESTPPTGLAVPSSNDHAADSMRKPSKGDSTLAVIADGFGERRGTKQSPKPGDGRGSVQRQEGIRKVATPPKHQQVITTSRQPSAGDEAGQGTDQPVAAAPANDSQREGLTRHEAQEAGARKQSTSSQAAERVERDAPAQETVAMPQAEEAVTPPATVAMETPAEPEVRPEKEQAKQADEEPAEPSTSSPPAQPLERASEPEGSSVPDGSSVSHVLAPLKEEEHAHTTVASKEDAEKHATTLNGLVDPSKAKEQESLSSKDVAGKVEMSKGLPKNAADEATASRDERPESIHEKQQQQQQHQQQHTSARAADLPRAATVPAASADKGLTGQVSRQQKRVVSKKAISQGQLDESKIEGPTGRVLKAGKYVGAAEHAQHNSRRPTGQGQMGALPSDVVDTAVRRIKTSMDFGDGTGRARSPERPKPLDLQLDRPISRTQLSSEEGSRISGLTTRASSPGSKAPRHLWFSQPTRSLMHNHSVPNLAATNSTVKGKGLGLGGRLAPLLRPAHVEAANISADAREKIQKFGTEALLELADDDVEELAVTICRAVSLPLLREGREPCDLPGHNVGPHSPKPYRGDADFIVRSWFGRMGDKRSPSPSSRKRSPSPLRRCGTAAGSSRPTTVPSRDDKSRSTSPEDNFQRMKLGVAQLGGVPSDTKQSPLLPCLRPATSTVTMRARTPGALPGTRTTGGHAGRLGHARSGPLAPMLLQQKSRADVQLSVAGGSPRS